MADVPGRSRRQREHDKNHQPPTAHTIIPAKITHADGGSDKPIHMAVAAFLGNRAAKLGTVAKCGREATFACLSA
jgi:hypothetical protein